MRRFVLSLAWCYFVLVFFSPLSIAIISLGEERERANLSAFRMFVRFALVWFCLFPLSFRFWEGLQLKIVALPVLFFYHFFYISVISCCRVLIVVSSLYSFDFYVLGDVALMS